MIEVPRVQYVMGFPVTLFSVRLRMTADWNLDLKATALDPMRQTLNPLFGASSTEVLNMDLRSAFLTILPAKKHVSGNYTAEPLRDLAIGLSRT